VRNWEEKGEKKSVKKGKKRGWENSETNTEKNVQVKYMRKGMKKCVMRKSACKLVTLCAISANQDAISSSITRESSCSTH
jgi:hypothetical protein